MSNLHVETEISPPEPDEDDGGDTDRREEIGALIRAQLEADGELDAGDVITHWTALVGMAVADDDGNEGVARAVRSQQAMAIHTELGLISERWMYIQAVMTDAHRRTQEDGNG